MKARSAVVSRAEVFDRNRPLLFSIAYRMTGSVMEARMATGKEVTGR